MAKDEPSGSTEMAERDGYYEFNNLMVYVPVDGVEYLAGYTVEVEGGTGDEALNVPVTIPENTTDGVFSIGQAMGTQPWPAEAQGTNPAVTYKAGNADVDVIGNHNYALLWGNSAGQTVEVQDPDWFYTVYNAAEGDVRNTSTSTLDGMIVLAGNTTSFTQDTNYKIVQQRETPTGTTTVRFDLARGCSESLASSGFGYFNSSAIEGKLWFDADFDGVDDTEAADRMDTEVPEADRAVVLEQWYYLDGTFAGDLFTPAPLKNNKGTTLVQLDAVTYDGTNETIELVRDDANNVIGAWIKNPNFGDVVTTEEEVDGATVTVDSYAGSFTQNTDSLGRYRFANMLPYVQFDAEGNPLYYGEFKSDADYDILAVAGYRVVVPELPENNVLTVYHSAAAGAATDSDSDAKRDVLRDARVTAYPQFIASGEQHDFADPSTVGTAESTGFIITALRAGITGNYTVNYQNNASAMASVAYDVAGPAIDRSHVNAGLFQIPVAEIDGYVWDDTEYADGNREDNVASDGQQYKLNEEDGEQGIADQTVYATQWFFVPASSPLFDQIDDATSYIGSTAGVVEWVTETGAIVKGAKPAGTLAGAWVQNAGFGSDWVTTKENTGDDAEENPRVPVVSGGTSVKDVNDRDAMVAVLTADAERDADGNVISADELGHYVFDNLPTAVVKYNQATGTDEYFLAAYRLELKDVVDAGEVQPWHLTSLHQGTDLFADSDANRYDRGLGINGSGDDKGSYQIIQRYNADGSLRANQGQVIIAHTAADMSAGIPEAFATIPVDNAMDSSVDSATIYHWTDPQSQKGGDVGEIAAALRTISGYAWCDNGYNDGTYTYTPGKYYDDVLGADRDLTQAAENGYYGKVGLTVYLRQWYFDEDTQTWVAMENYRDNFAGTSDVPFAMASTVTAESGSYEGRALHDGYFEFANLPVSVYVDGKERLAGYTLAVEGDSTLTPTYFQTNVTNDPALHTDPTAVDENGVPTSPVDEAKIDQWNSKAHDRVVGVQATPADVARYGRGVFPVYRNNDDDGFFTSVATSSDSNIHTLDTVLVLAGSQTKDASERTSVAEAQYAMNTTYDGVDVAFDFTYGKHEGRMNAGFTEPPNAPISGYIWNDVNYNGIREQEYVVDDYGNQIMQEGSEPGYKGVGVWAYKYYLNDAGQWVRVPDVSTDDGFEEPEYVTTDENGYYEFARMRTSYDVTTPDPVSGTDITTYYLAAYRLYVEKLPAGATMTRSHNAGAVEGTAIADTSSYGVESDIYRSSANANTDLPLVHRLVETKNMGAQDGQALTRADGLVITARPLPHDGVAATNRKEYKDIIYDVSGGVNMAFGGDAGLIAIPSTSITGLVWDDSYHAVANDVVADARARENAYNGQQDSNEKGLSGITMMLTQWTFNTTTQTWSRETSYGTNGVRSVLTGDGTGTDATTQDGTNLGVYTFDKVPSAVRRGTAHTPTSAEDLDTANLGAATLGTLYDDSYLLASYQVEIDGFTSGSTDGARMLTRYHEGVPTDDPENDSDVASADRTGAAGGRVVSNQATIAGVTGTRVGGAYAATNAGAGARIVVASEGKLGTTHLADDADYRSVPMNQLLDEGTGTVAFDWLTVDGTPLAGGSVGTVEPTKQSIRGILWNDANNNGLMDDRNDSDAAYGALDGYRVDLERYWYDPTDPAANAEGWVLDTTFQYQGTDAAGTAIDGVLTGVATEGWFMDGASVLALGTGQEVVGNFLLQHGRYEFTNLDTVHVGDGDTLHVYGYKPVVIDSRVVANDEFRSKYQVGEDYKLDSDLQATNSDRAAGLSSTRGAYLVADNEYMVLLEVVDDENKTPSGQISQASNIRFAPRSHNADQTNGENAKTDPVNSNLVAYDLMNGADRAHNDGGILIPQTYSISGFLWADEDYDGIYNYAPETRFSLDEESGEVLEETFQERGYNNKRVILKKWFYNTATNAWEPQMVTNSEGQRVQATEENFTHSVGVVPAVDTDGNILKRPLYENGAPKRDENGNIMTDATIYRIDAPVQTAYDPALAGPEEIEVEGEYRFDNLTTYYRVRDNHNEWVYYLAGYTVEVDGSNTEEGMFSSLVTSYEWMTTAKDQRNSNALPIKTEQNYQGNAWDPSISCDDNNYAVVLGKSTVQTGTFVDNEGMADDVFGEPGERITKNALTHKIVLAGIGDDDSLSNQSVQTTGDGVDVNFDFVVGQSQTSLNAGFAPPDHAKLVGDVWFDEDYDGLLTDDSMLENVQVILSQWYFVPEYDYNGHQLLEDNYENVFYYESAPTPSDPDAMRLRLYRASVKGNVQEMEINGVPTVVLFENDHSYNYQLLLNYDTNHELHERGEWVLNTNFQGVVPEGYAQKTAALADEEGTEVGDGTGDGTGTGEGEGSGSGEGSGEGEGTDPDTPNPDNPDPDNPDPDNPDPDNPDPDNPDPDNPDPDNPENPDEPEQPKLELESWQSLTLTDDEGRYTFDDLPGYILLDDEETNPSKPEDMTNVYQPQDEAWTEGQKKFETAKAYMAGYSVSIVDEGEYLASRFHVANSDPNVQDSDLFSFEANMYGNYNEDGTVEETKAVVSQKSKAGGFAHDTYEVTYRNTTYDLANRMSVKHAGDAGLTTQEPVRIDGRVWEDADANGLQDEGEIGIEGAVVKLTRYWYDTTGYGVYEPQPGDDQTPPEPDRTGLTQEEIDAIAALDESDPEALIEWINTRTTRVELEVFGNLHYDYLYGVGQEGSDRVTAALNTRLAELKDDIRFDPSGAGIWRRDWTFSQNDVETLVLGTDEEGEETEVTQYNGVSIADVENFLPEGEGFVGKDGSVSYPGSAYTLSLGSGNWAFTTDGTGYHVIDTSGNRVKVLYGYRVEVVSYPNADNYVETLQHVFADEEGSDPINSDFDEKTGALRPNKKDVTLDSAVDSVGDLIILSRLADRTEGTSTPGPSAVYSEINGSLPQIYGRSYSFGQAVTSLADQNLANVAMAAAELDDEVAGTPTDPTDPTDPDTPNVPTTNPNEVLDDGVTVTVEALEQATLEQLENLTNVQREQIFGRQIGTATTGEPLYDGSGDPELRQAYNARLEALYAQRTFNNWSDLGWHDSLHHGYGLVPIARAHIAGIIWEDTNYNGIQDEDETWKVTSADKAVPLTLTRYWYGIDEFGVDGWHEDEAFNSNETRTHTTCDEDGSWIFDNLEVAGAHLVAATDEDGKLIYKTDDAGNRIPLVDEEGNAVTDEKGNALFELEMTTALVIYGFEVTVDDLPTKYGVTKYNVGADPEVDSDLDEMTKLLDPANPSEGYIVLCAPASDFEWAEEGESSFVRGPINGGSAQATRAAQEDRYWAINAPVDSDYNDTGLVPYATASIGGTVFVDPEGDGLKGTTYQPYEGALRVYLDRKVLDDKDLDVVGFNAAAYESEAQKAITDKGIEGGSGWTTVAWQDINGWGTDEEDLGKYLFEGLPMVDDEGRPYIYRVWAELPEGYAFVTLNAGANDADDSDWWKSVDNERVGMTPGMAVLGMFTAVRTEPNAYGQRYNLLVSYDWTDEVGRPVDLGMRRNNPLVPTKVLTPDGKRLPKTGDENNLLGYLALAALAGLVLLLAAKRRRDEEEEEELAYAEAAEAVEADRSMK